MRRALGALLFLLVFVFVACAVYGPSLLSGVEAGTDAPITMDAGDAGPGCDGATWPGRPAKDDPATYFGGEFVLALQTIHFDPDAGGGNLVGYDLDRACTCPGKGSCNPSGDASLVCDDPMGRDNSGGVLLSSFSAFAGDVFDSMKLNQKISDGVFTLLVRIKDYNGSQNDTQITTAIFISDGNKGAEDGGTPSKPKFDGTDDWTVDPTSLFGGVGPPYVPLPDSVDTMAYVTNGMLVAVIGEVKIILSGTGNGSVGLDVSGAVITGHLTPKGNSFSIDDGVLAARWPTRKMLTTLAGIKDPIGMGYLCGDSGTYLQIKKLICDVRDIVTAVQNDNTGAFCDALSIGFGFGATPARMGNMYQRPMPIPPCGAQWDDDCLK
jgi:hypothetical protein